MKLPLLKKLKETVALSRLSNNNNSNNNNNNDNKHNFNKRSSQITLDSISLAGICFQQQLKIQNSLSCDSSSVSFNQLASLSSTSSFQQDQQQHSTLSDSDYCSSPSSSSGHYSSDDISSSRSSNSSISNSRTSKNNFADIIGENDGNHQSKSSKWTKKIIFTNSNDDEVIYSLSSSPSHVRQCSPSPSSLSETSSLLVFNLAAYLEDDHGDYNSLYNQQATLLPVA